MRPKVYVNGVAWPDTIAADTPALDGLTTSWQTKPGSPIMEDRATVRLLQRTTTPATIDIGDIVAIIIPASTGVTRATAHVGRIADLHAEPTKRYGHARTDPTPAILYTITTESLSEWELGSVAVTQSMVDAQSMNSIQAYQTRETGWRNLITAALNDASVKRADEGNLTTSSGVWGTFPSGIPRSAPITGITSPTPLSDFIGRHLRGYARQWEPRWWVDNSMVIQRALAFVRDPTEAIATLHEIPSSRIPTDDIAWTKSRNGIITGYDFRYIYEQPANNFYETSLISVASNAHLQRYGRNIVDHSTHLHFTTTDLIDGKVGGHMITLRGRYLTAPASGALPWDIGVLPIRDVTPADLALFTLTDGSDWRLGRRIAVTGTHVNTPDTVSAQIQGLVTGVEATWHRDKWSLNVTLRRHNPT